MTLTSDQVDAITHAHLDCVAASNLPDDHNIDLDGLAEAAGNSAEELEQAFPFLAEGVEDE
tara:strand:- start:4 stop:186 length:183 start_codon:yes stop_codon:yes gene_type:complete